MVDYRAVKGHFIERLTDVIRVINPVEHHVTVDAPVGKFRVDSRLVKAGDVFVATAGARTDGHKYVDEVLARGAAGAIVSSLDSVSNPERCMVVPDPLVSLRVLAAAHRRSLDVRIIGLTGSMGKTTTKELLAALMDHHAPTRKSKGNYNNTIGLPMELLKLRRDERWMIAEMGMSTPGEIATVTRIADPDIGMLMCVRAVHLANFESIDHIARAKAELVDELRPDATLVYNLDDPLVRRHCDPFPGPKLTYGMTHPRAQIRGRFSPFSGWEGTWFYLTDLEGKEHEIYLPIVGRYNVFNAVAAGAAALAAGVPAAQLKNGFMTASSAQGRSRLHVLRDQIRLVDDTYNSNPDAVSEVLRSFAPLAPHHYRWLILGDMLELGETEVRIHRELGYRLRRYGFRRITLIGPLSAHTYEALAAAKLDGLVLEHFATAGDAVTNMNLDIPSDARIWCKASRGIGLEVVARHIRNSFSPKPAKG